MSTLRNSALAAVALAGIFAASGASATIIIVEGDTPGSLTNVHFDEAQSGNTITGYTQPNKGGIGIEFTSPSTLTTTGIGQADITGTFTMITATPIDPNVGFQTFQFAFKLEAEGDATITGIDQFGTSFTETFADLSANTNHRFTLLALDEQVITSVNLTTTTNITNYRQIRLEPVDVPEPASLALLGTGLLGLGTVLRRKKGHVTA